MTTAHSNIGASSASRWMNCPASVKMSQGIKRTSSGFADEGTAAHALAEWCLVNYKDPNTRLGDSIRVGEVEFEITQEMASAVNEYCWAVDGTGRLGQEPYDILIEQKFNLDWLHKGMFGTCDCALKGKTNGKVKIFDLKYGAGKPVFARENVQLMYYALGVLGPQLDGTWYDEVELTIVQPRNELVGVDSWTISTKDLYTWAYEKLLPAAKATTSTQPKFSTGDWCRWCPALGACPELEKMMGEIANVDFSFPVQMEKEVDFPNPMHLTPTQKSRILHFAQLMKPWIGAVEKSAYEDAMQGRMLEGWKLVRKRASNRKWSDEKYAEQTFKSVLGEDIYEERKMKSPSEIEKLLGKGGKDEVAQFTYRAEAGLELKPETDKRPAINPMQSIENSFEYYEVLS